MLVVRGGGIEAGGLRARVGELTARSKLRMHNVGAAGSEFIYDVRLKKGVSAEEVVQALSKVAGVGAVNAVAGSEEP